MPTMRISGVPTLLLGARELADKEPNLRPGLVGALLVPEDAVVYPPVVAMHLARQAEKHGATLIQGKSVVKMDGGEVLLDDGTLMSAPRPRQCRRRLVPRNHSRPSCKKA